MSRKKVSDYLFLCSKYQHMSTLKQANIPDMQYKYEHTVKGQGPGCCISYTCVISQTG